MRLEVSEFSKSYETKEIFKNINFSFDSGKIYALIGKNGVGKTTFFNTLNEETDITSGQIYLTNKTETKKLTSDNIGYIPTIPVVPEFLTAKEFLKIFLDLNKEQIVNLQDIENYFSLIKINTQDQQLLLKDYSHGMKIKIQLLISILSNKEILLLDEPLTTLDIITQEEIKKILNYLKKDHIIILSTHVLELALDICDEIIIINNKNFKVVDKEKLNNEKIKNEIIKILKEQ